MGAGGGRWRGRPLEETSPGSPGGSQSWMAEPVAVGGGCKRRRDGAGGGAAGSGRARGRPEEEADTASGGSWARVLEPSTGGGGW
jgi:hypothetical protein